MSQFDFGNLASPTSGTALVDNNLEPWRDALHSGHMGPSRPSYVKAGMRWIDNSDADLWAMKLFTGSTDIIEAYADTVNNAIIPASGGAAGDVEYDNTASGLAAETVQAAIDELQEAKASIEQGNKADTAVQPEEISDLLAGWVEVSTTTIDSPVASVDVNNLGAYKDLLVIAIGLTVSANGDRWLRVSTDNGSTFLASAIYSKQDQSTLMSALLMSSGNPLSSTINVMAEITMSNTTIPFKPVSKANYTYNGIVLSSAINAIRVMNSAGNLTGGVVKVYGRK